MKSFVKHNNWWFEYNSNTPDFATTIFDELGREIQDVDIRGEETAQVKSIKELDWYGTRVYDNEKYKTGWLSPEGEFFGCDFDMCDRQARLVHGTTERELLDLGWANIKIHRTTMPCGCLDVFPKDLNYYVKFSCNVQGPTNEQLYYVEENYPQDCSTNKKMFNDLVEIRQYFENVASR